MTCVEYGGGSFVLKEALDDFTRQTQCYFDRVSFFPFSMYPLSPPLLLSALHFPLFFAHTYLSFSPLLLPHARKSPTRRKKRADICEEKGKAASCGKLRDEARRIHTSDPNVLTPATTNYGPACIYVQKFYCQNMLLVSASTVLTHKQSMRKRECVA